MIRLGLWAWAKKSSLAWHYILLLPLRMNLPCLAEGALAASSTVEWSASFSCAILWKHVTQSSPHSMGKVFKLSPVGCWDHTGSVIDWDSQDLAWGCMWGCAVTAEAREMPEKWFERNQTDASTSPHSRSAPGEYNSSAAAMATLANQKWSKAAEWRSPVLSGWLHRHLPSMGQDDTYLRKQIPALTTFSVQAL